MNEFLPQRSEPEPLSSQQTTSEWIADPLLVGLQRFPDAACITDDHRSLSFAEVDRRADQLSMILTAEGVRPGDRVGLFSKNTVELIEVHLACIRLGAVYVPFNFRLTAAELALLIEDSGTRLLICSEILAPIVAELGQAHLSFGNPYEEMLAAQAIQARTEYRYPASNLNAILYTSGTTGRPKGAVFTNRVAWSRIMTLAREFRIREGDTLIHPMPAFHVTLFCIYAWIVVGGRSVTPANFDPVQVAELSEFYNGTHLMVVPTMLRAICDDPKAMDHDFHALRFVLYGASGVAPAVLGRALDAFGCEFIQTYGCTEIAPMAVLQPEDHRPDEAPHLLRSGGRAPVGTQVRIVDEAGHDLPVGEAGEIVARSMSAVTEYWGQPELSRARGLGDWLRTGDAGCKDEHGYVYVLDRVDDIIVTGGENVSSREVEAVLYEHPAVAEVAVIGVSDEEWGSRIHAVVVPAVEDISPETLRDYCRERLAGFKVPKTVALVDSLPMNSVGKLLKREIRRQIEEGTWNEDGRHDENG